MLIPLSLQVSPVADWEGVEGCGGASPAPAAPLLLVFPLLVASGLEMEVDAAAPDTDQFVFPGEKELLVVLLVALPGQTEGEQRHKVRHWNYLIIRGGRGLGGPLPFLTSVLGERRRREQVFLSVAIISSTRRPPSQRPTSSTSSSLTSAPLSLL